MSHWKREKSDQEARDLIKNTRGTIGSRSLTRDQRQAFGRLAQSGEIKGYVGDSGAMRYHK